MRADALRNRDQIVAAARVLFITHGVEAPMEEIAKAAGVGVGTLYRRFPDRGALMDAVTVDVFHRLTGMIATARDEESSAWDALRRFLREWAEFRLGLLQDPLCSGMSQALRTNSELREIRTRWLELFERTVQEAQQAGDLRRDVGLMEIATFMNLLIRDEQTETTGRILAFMLDGLAVTPGT
ncbi:AcrR family transcriptional regulator [Kibdelosporangium banguiense]|uniref:AcrR family transcriptional regulator n=1 Tax=Kibdelosporangium banguiense TaxID=1365924 RepID=A0ABS4TN66_9PSEU|nr:TetR/AcrR family transcriptional regulator [Kibdelosporangium banguiense]MBP2325846.1 AcrR family transcriptional regulator [Kibdelosporangium banguiense]